MIGLEEGLRLRRQGEDAICQVRGRGTMRQSPALRRLADEPSAAGAVRLWIDLRECTHMDSTFLGTLVFLRRDLEARGGELTLVSPSPECRRLLRHMGLEGVLTIATADPPPDDEAWSELGPDTDGPGFQRNIVEAHRELAQLPGPIGETFREVASRLSEEWIAAQSRSRSP